MTPLRQRLIEELTLRGYADHTIDAHVRAVARLARFYHTAPDGITEDQLRSYLLRVTSTLAPASVTQALSGLRFFYERCSGGAGRSWISLAPSAKRSSQWCSVATRSGACWPRCACPTIACVSRSSMGAGPSRASRSPARCPSVACFPEDACLASAQTHH